MVPVVAEGNIDLPRAPGGKNESANNPRLRRGPHAYGIAPVTVGGAGRFNLPRRVGGGGRRHGIRGDIKGKETVYRIEPAVPRPPGRAVDRRTLRVAVR